MLRKSMWRSGIAIACWKEIEGVRICKHGIEDQLNGLQFMRITCYLFSVGKIIGKQGVKLGSDRSTGYIQVEIMFGLEFQLNDELGHKFCNITILIRPQRREEKSFWPSS